ncbi:hypothetical protein G7054_g3540 [Neopestalotiopsis clavispora]|nr:hypothetical protein G7054_g3540 [Neopestalotiopsis clavispora]
MSSRGSSFAKNVTGPLVLLDAYCDCETNQVQVDILRTPEAIEGHLNHPVPQDYTHRFISICQWTSWSSLQVSKTLLELLVLKHNVSHSFWQLPSYFYYRNEDVEINSCLPVTSLQQGSRVEFKPDNQMWAIRQTGLYHQIDMQTNKSLSILFSPTPHSLAHQKVEEAFNRCKQDNDVFTNPLWIHDLLFTTYSSAWREYIIHLEYELMPIVNTTFSTYIEEPLHIGYNSLNELLNLDSRLFQISTLCAHGEDTIKRLLSIFEPGVWDAMTPAMTTQLVNCCGQTQNFSRTALCLQRKAQNTCVLLTNSVSYRDQIVGKEQSKSMLHLSKSAMFITTMGLFYLPPSFIAHMLYHMEESHTDFRNQFN